MWTFALRSIPAAARRSARLAAPVLLCALALTSVVPSGFAACAPSAPPATAPAKKPNIVVIWGDDIGQFNVSAYNMGMMGYRTPNIDSIGRQGAVFTD